MPMELRATSNLPEVFAKLDAWTEDVITKAAPIALNKLGDQARVAGERVVRKTYGLTIDQFNKYISVTFAKGGSLEYVITATGKGFPMILFKARQTKLGVQVVIKGRTVLIPHAFIKSIGSGGAQVWARGSYNASASGSGTTGKGAGKRRKRGIREATGRSAFESTGESFGRFAFGRNRFPITLLRSTTPPSALINPDVVSAMNERINEQAQKVFAAAIKYIARG